MTLISSYFTGICGKIDLIMLKFNDYILYGDNNELKKDSYIDLTTKKSIEEVIEELNRVENN